MARHLIYSVADEECGKFCSKVHNMFLKVFLVTSKGLDLTYVHIMSFCVNTIFKKANMKIPLNPTVVVECKIQNYAYFKKIVTKSGFKIKILIL